jgi:hypothetical protein
MCTDANLAGLSNEAMDLESVETSMLIVKPIMGVWPHEAPDTPEDVALTFEKARCVAINGKKVTPLQAMLEANNIAGRNGVGITHALENRLLGTKSRGVYEAPGMTLLGEGLALVYAPPSPRVRPWAVLPHWPCPSRSKCVPRCGPSREPPPTGLAPTRKSVKNLESVCPRKLAQSNKSVQVPSGA